LKSIGYFERRYHQEKNMTDIDPDLVERTRRYLIAKRDFYGRYSSQAR
jgi:hypothetical protein